VIFYVIPNMQQIAIPPTSLQAWTGPYGFRSLRLPGFIENRHMKVVWSSALCTGYLFLPGYIPGTHFCQSLSRPQGHIEARSIKSIKNPIEPIGNRTRYLPTCRAVPQTIAPPHACISRINIFCV